MVYADDVNLLGDNVDTIKKSTETIIYYNNEVRIKVNAEESKYILRSRSRNAGQNYDIKIGNRAFENSAQFRYLGTTV
jgi:hypothetical protein